MSCAHCVVVDTIPYRGGSKIATEKALRLFIEQGGQVSVLGRDPSSWKLPGVRYWRLREWSVLVRREQGLGYFLRHGLIFIQLCALLFFKRPTVMLGASGPGNDLAIYLARWLWNVPLVQWNHGPVACSRTLGRALCLADWVFYLSSSRPSLEAALHVYAGAEVAQEYLANPRWQPICNGLARQEWPTRCQTKQVPQLFWAASLLKWKGLDVLIEALQCLPEPLPAHICYLRPAQTALSVSEICPQLPASHWYEAPNSLDALRARCNIFVSTSSQEPFGLSVLEAMAAGLAVLIPADGAYWDEHLTDGKDCLKYAPGNARALAECLLRLKHDAELRDRLGRAATLQALAYRAERVYQPVVSVLKAV
ncbi:glycosyltransferase family 4 protein [Pseudomonas anguilliseptica]|uniref:glycosyltransferase family 4 protein n=1 Tax=Pseudomonas anguilliseptica TaxID=53406 RepID=UPI00325A44FD